MENPKNPLSVIAYFILGLIVIAVAVKVIWWLVGLAIGLLSIAISVLVVIAVGYVVYQLLKVALKSDQ